jgi:hypothetical protein
MTRKLTDALPDGPNPLRAAVWEFLRPMLSPRLAALHRDTFGLDQPLETTVELAAHRAVSDLADLDLGDDTDAAAASAELPIRPRVPATPSAGREARADPFLFARCGCPARPIADLQPTRGCS